MVDTTTPDDSHEYTSLGGDRRIRVLVLEAPTFQDEVMQCSLEEIELDAKAQYSALSYSWATETGDATKSRSIELDGKPFPVTENLHTALLRIRSDKQEPQRLWVDAVCINQDDAEEKSRQVSMMEHIYSFATKVIGWLGNGTSEREDEAAYTAMKCIIADKEIAPSWSPNRMLLRLDHTWLSPPRSAQNPKQCLICVEWDVAHPDCLENYGGTSEQLPELKRAFMTLLRRRYFKRRWIIQEVNVAVAEAVIFRWGRHSLSRDDFITGQDVGTRGIPGDILVVKDVLKFCEPASLIDLIGHANAAACSEPRDRVYALLSLAFENEMESDYSRSVAETYTLFARLCLQEQRTYNLFQACSGVQKQSADPIENLPSWVPDLREHFQLHLADQKWRDSGGVERCQTICSEDGILSINLYQIGICAQPTQDEKDFHVPALDLVSRQVLSTVKIYRHGGLREPAESDLLCSLDPPEQYMAGAEVRAGITGFMLRPVQDGRAKNAWRIVNPFDMVYKDPEIRSWELKRFSIV